MDPHIFGRVVWLEYLNSSSTVDTILSSALLVYWIHIDISSSKFAIDDVATLSLVTGRGVRGQGRVVRGFRAWPKGVTASWRIGRSKTPLTPYMWSPDPHPPDLCTSSYYATLVHSKQ